MKVIVATAAENCLASRALLMEGIVHEEHVCQGEFGYGRLIADTWRQGEGFILVEHDIVPWPGALRAMWDCGALWCGYPYPYFDGPVGSEERLFGSHGCGCCKFSTVLVQGWPDLPTQWKWDTHSWRSLDGVIGNSIVDAYRDAPRHEHRPPVAHLRAGTWNRLRPN